MTLTNCPLCHQLHNSPDIADTLGFPVIACPKVPERQAFVIDPNHPPVLIDERDNEA